MTGNSAARSFLETHMKEMDCVELFYFWNNAEAFRLHAKQKSDCSHCWLRARKIYKHHLVPNHSEFEIEISEQNRKELEKNITNQYGRYR